MNTKKKKGRVYIIGAGPGDTGLLTIKGLKCLKKAEVVVYDYHLNAQVLNYVSHEAEFIYAGKRSGNHAMTQDEINRALIEKAREGKIVCRLKGGDPFVFGRGGEEAEALAAEKIAFEIIPGVSSAIAAAAYAGIPLTHRDYSSSFAVIPGSEISTRAGRINWEKLATGVDTLVFLMAVENIERVSEELLKNGKPAKTPVAVIRWGTRSDQITITGTLGKITGLISEQGIKPPAVVIVGEVVKLRDKLKWYEDMPMFGQRILVAHNHSFAFERLEELGAEVIEFPTRRPSAGRKKVLHFLKEGRITLAIFASAAGVNNFFEIMGEEAANYLREVKIGVIGDLTRKAAEARGLKVHIAPEQKNMEALVTGIIRWAAPDYYEQHH